MLLKFEKNGREYTCDTEALGATSLAYLLQYGWSQSLQDCIAGRAKRVSEEMAAAQDKDGNPLNHSDETIAAAVDADLDGTLQKRAAAIIAGTVAQRESSTKDPFESMCIRVATEMLSKALKASKTTVKRDSDKWAELLKQVRTKYEDSITKEAKRRMKATEAVEIEI